jgi:hypothetical protein
MLRGLPEIGPAPSGARLHGDDPRKVLALDTQHGKARSRRHVRGFGLGPTATLLLPKPPDTEIWVFSFLRDLQVKKRADERTRTAYPCPLRVINRALLGFARACNTHLPKANIPLLILAMERRRAVGDVGMR